MNETLWSEKTNEVASDKEMANQGKNNSDDSSKEEEV